MRGGKTPTSFRPPCRCADMNGQNLPASEVPRRERFDGGKEFSALGLKYRPTRYWYAASIADAVTGPFIASGCGGRTHGSKIDRGRVKITHGHVIASIQITNPRRPRTRAGDFVYVFIFNIAGIPFWRKKGVVILGNVPDSMRRTPARKIPATRSRIDIAKKAVPPQWIIGVRPVISASRR